MVSEFIPTNYIAGAAGKAALSGDAAERGNENGRDI